MKESKERKQLVSNPEELHKDEAMKKRAQREIKLESNPEELHKFEAMKRRTQRKIQLENNPEELHRVEAMSRRTQREIQLERNPEELHKVEAMKRRTQREIELESNPEELHEIEAKSKRNQRNHNKTKINQIDRLRNFKRSVLFGPIFVCSSCHVKHFESNVTIVDEDFEAKLFEKYQDCYSECVRDFVEVKVNEDTNYYFCKTCVTYMKSKRIPPMSVCNGLDIIHQDDPDLQLSELENNLIALRIMFQKIYYLPKSRWTGLKDRVINIPIEKESLMNTIETLPRLPAESGLVEVKLKRKIEYKQSHKREYVDPNKIFKALEYLRESGHPGYKDFNTKE